MTLRLGIFARTFVRPNATAVAAAVADHGFALTQLNLSSVGLPTLPDPVHAVDFPSIRRAFEDAGVFIWGLSGTYNTIHPDPIARRRETAKAVALIGHAAGLGAAAVTLCTGTRDPENIWRAHPDNGSAAAWSDLRATLDELIPAAQAAGVQLGVEPEPGNVIRDAAAAHRLLHELGSDADTIGIVLDPANLVTPETIDSQPTVLCDAFELLGGQTICLHAKDVVANGGYAAAGLGGLDYDLILRLHADLPTDVPVVIQDVAEDDVQRTRDFLLAHDPARS